MDERPALWEPDDEDLAFWEFYGPWEPLTPGELAELMAGFPRPWWVVGGQAIDAFTGIRRAHEDIDMVVFSDDVPALREQVGARYHLWSNFSGTFRLIDDRHPEPLDPLSQVWARRNASSPWVFDCPLNPRQDGRWVSKRDPDHVADLEEVTWMGGDGVRYLAPEVVLRFKATQRRPKDDVDLARTWPLLSTAAQSWLRDAVRRAEPDNPWLERMG